MRLILPRDKECQNELPSLRITIIVCSSLYNRTFIKEKGFGHPEDLFKKDISIKFWRDLCKPPEPDLISIVREFYAYLVDQALKRVWVRGKWVPFDSETINSLYNLPNVDNEAFEKLKDEPITRRSSNT